MEESEHLHIMDKTNSDKSKQELKLLSNIGKKATDNLSFELLIYAFCLLCSCTLVKKGQ